MRVMSDFKPGDKVATKSGKHYIVASPASPREGKIFAKAVVRTRGSGWAWLTASSLKLVEAAPPRTMPAEQAGRLAKEAKALTLIMEVRMAMGRINGAMYNSRTPDPEDAQIARAALNEFLELTIFDDSQNTEGR